MAGKKVRNSRRASLEHHVPGRTRLKLDRTHYGQGHVEDIHARLKDLPGVEHVAFNHRTGSYLVHHSRDPAMLRSIATVTGEVAGEVLEFVEEAEELELAGLCLVAGLVVSEVSTFIVRRLKPSKKPGLVHHSHGRTRFKLPDRHRDEAHMTMVRERLKSVSGVHDVHYNHRTGSLTIHHDSQHQTMGEVGDVMKEFCSELFDCVVHGENPVVAGVHVFAHAVHNNGTGPESENALMLAGTLAIGLMFSNRILT